MSVSDDRTPAAGLSDLEFITINPGDELLREAVAANEHARSAYAMQLQHYAKAGYEEPWVGYLVRKEGVLVGVCSFIGSPTEGKVEIAYFTFPEYEGKGIATGMCRRLLEIARRHDSSILVTAHTLPRDGPSTRILVKNEFRLAGTTTDPDEGVVWDWHYLGGLPPERGRPAAENSARI